MASLNQCSFIGNVGNLDVHFLKSGEAVANLSLAVNETWKDKQGQKQEHTEWVRVRFFGALADIVQKYVKKGDLLYVSGSMRTRKYTDKDGIEKYATEIRGDRMQMLGGRDNDGQPRPQQSSQPQQSSGNGFDDMEDEIPF